MRKTKWVWVMIVLIAFNLLGDIFSLTGVDDSGITQYYGNNNILNFMDVALFFIDLIISSVFLYKLFSLKNLILWVDISFGFTLLFDIFLLVADEISGKGGIFASILIGLVTIGIWFLFRKHVKRISSLSN